MIENGEPLVVIDFVDLGSLFWSRLQVFAVPCKTKGLDVLKQIKRNTRVCHLRLHCKSTNTTISMGSMEQGGKHNSWDGRLETLNMMLAEWIKFI